MSKTLSSGGLQTGMFTRTFIGWDWITLAFLVSIFLYSFLVISLIVFVFIVATSTAVERVFSQGRQLLSFTRNRLAAQSIRSFLCLGSWGRHDLIIYDDVVAAVNGNSKRKKKMETDVEIISE